MIGVVVLNWNELEQTTACLESLLDAEPGPARVVVVDNGSADGSADALERWLAIRGDPRLALLRSPQNRGFAGGVNLGLAQLARDAAVSHFLLLNNDATVERTFFAELHRAMTRIPGAAIVGPTIYRSDRRDTVWYAGGRLPGLRGVAVHHHELPPGDDPVPTEFVSGCALLVSRSAWERLGPVPECYFIYFEDAEYCRRARDAGLRVLYAPRAVAHHAVAGTMGRDGARPAAAYRFTRAQALYLRRNLTGWLRIGALLYFAVTRPARAAIEAVHGRVGVAWGLLRGAARGLVA
ncbi:MAG: glycosyltransferase family 2 protein [Gemmatimonadales bacterium]